MALAQIVDDITTVPEAARGAYVEKDGKFHLDFEVEDTTALRSAAKKERDRANALEKEIKSWKATGKTAAEIAELLAEQEESERKAAEKSGDHAKILKQHQDAWTKKEKELADEVAASRASERSAIVGERLLGALAKAGVTEEGSELLPDRLSSRIKFETVDSKRVLKIMQADGETPMAGSGADGVATIDDLVKETVKKYPSQFKGTGAGGGGTPPKGGGGSGAKTMPEAEFNDLSPKERAAKMAEPGFKLT